MKKKIAILGSTGSIGTQALEVIEQHNDLFEVDILTARNNTDLLIEQALRYKPNTVVIGNEEKYDDVNNVLFEHDIKVYAGDKAIEQIVESTEIDIVLVALVGFAGLKPTINAIKGKKKIALANKETLVVAGDLITKLASENKSPIIPVDSEHSAIFQCLVGEGQNNIEKIVLTASGGPFRGYTKEQLANVTKKQALKHPNWDMGSKITIDSASLMNKGLEAIEAKWLFGLKPDQIEVIIHPQSIIHSLVQFEDGSMKAQMGLPDMKLPIQYAFTFPNRVKSNFERFNFMDYPELNFIKPDTETFRNLELAYTAMENGGNMPCALNAANEIVVDAFLHDKISFFKMPDIIEQAINKINFISSPSFDDYFNTDEEARQITKSLI
jgi:1-deoxy-D-xylulose-5-phosphate reductoisomerase